MKEKLKLIGLIILTLLVSAAYIATLAGIILGILTEANLWERVLWLIVYTVFVSFVTAIIIYIIKHWRNLYD